MSQRWDQVEEQLDEYESQIDTVYKLYHIPVLAALMVFMLWVRVRNMGRHVGADGQPLFRGNDPFYHYRTTNYVVHNFPFNLGFDPWSGFDAGTSAGQFGTIMDQTVATVALVVGLGSPAESTVLTVALLSGPVFAMLCAIPLYFVGKRLGGRFGGIVAVTILALTPGEFLSRSVAGYYGHHVTEVLTMLVVILVAMKMFTVAQREQPIYELVQTREFDELRTPLAWAAALGVAITLALLNWPPAIFFFGVLAVVLFVHLSLEFLRGYSPDHVVVPTVAAMLVTTVLSLPFVATTELSVTTLSILHPILALAVAGGAVFMAGLARVWESEVDLTRAAYPVGIVGAGVVLVGVVAVALPSLFEFFVGQAERVLGFGAQAGGGTVGEAQPPADPAAFFFERYGLAFYTGLLGVAMMAVSVLRSRRPRAEVLLVVVFSLFMLAFTLTQRRFDYYLVIGVASANAYVVGWVYNYVDLDDVRRDVSNVEPYQLLVVFSILFVIAAPLLISTAAAPNVVDAGDRHSQPGEIMYWEDSLDWLSENTPEPGAYGSGDDPRLEYYGSYDQDDFQYEDGEYGVMAWWDYGHYITTRGERIPVANPFQQHASESADFLLADDEEQAIQALEEDAGSGEGVRYVMVDYDLGVAGTTKYNAPAHWETRHGLETPDIGTVVVVQEGNQQRLAGTLHTQRAYESLRVQLYQFHGSAIEPSRSVVEFEEYHGDQGFAVNPVDTEQYQSAEAAAAAADENPNAVHGGLDGPQERVEALEHFRMVHASDFDTDDNPFQQSVIGLQPWVKTFERVKGATIEGTGPADAEVVASVELDVPATEETEFYTQYAETDADGNFEMTVPYSTTGYDEWGTDEGYTDVDVRATGAYELFAETDEDIWTGEVEVTEGQVIGEDDAPATVEMQEGLPEDAFDPEEQQTDDEETDDEVTGDADTAADDEDADEEAGDEEAEADETDDGAGDEETVDDGAGGDEAGDEETDEETADDEADGQERQQPRSP